jgi:predicted NBD/HSP70 family sugar kinase
MFRLIKSIGKDGMQLVQYISEKILVLAIEDNFINPAIFSTGKLITKLPKQQCFFKASKEEIIAIISNIILNAGKIDRIVLIISGEFDYKNGIFLSDDIFPALKGTKFSEIFKDIPETFINSCNAFLLGELMYGAAKGFLRVGAVNFESNFESAFAIGSDLQNNLMGGPIEEINLGNKQFLDGAVDDCFLTKSLLKDFQNTSVEKLIFSAKNGDLLAKKTCQNFSEKFYLLLEEWKNKLNPEVFVLSSKLKEVLHLGYNIPANLNIVFSSLGEDALLYGAYAYAQQIKFADEVADDVIRRAASIPENLSLYQQFLQQATEGKELTIGVLGGSITAGAACNNPDKRYHGIFLDYLRKRFPKSTFNLVNTGIGATDSIYGAFRAKSHLLKHNPNLVILDFAVNDTDDAWWAKSYEGVIRQILALKIPIIQLFMTHNHQCNCQRFQELIGRHYQLAMVSYRDAIVPEILSGTLHWENLSLDAVHPNAEAHSFAGKLLCALFEKIPLLSNKSNYVLPLKLISDEFEKTFLMEKDSFIPDANSGWEKTDKSLGTWFGNRYFSAQTGSSMSFSFEGQSLWISYLGMSENAGRILVQVDEQIPVVIDGHFPHNWADPKVLWIQVYSNLPRTKHKAVVTLLADHHIDGGTEFYFCGAAGSLHKD